MRFAEEYKAQEKQGCFPAIYFLLVIPCLITFAGWIVALAALFIGFAVYGWSRRHRGPFATNRTCPDFSENPADRMRQIGEHIRRAQGCTGKAKSFQESLREDEENYKKKNEARE